MEATFFVARTEDALGVHCIEDLSCEPAGEPLRIPTTRVLAALVESLCGEPATRLEPLRDATCRSFPVFHLEHAVACGLARLDEEGCDDVALRWLEHESWREGDTDLHELSTLLCDVSDALRRSRDLGDRLFVLLEEKAL